MRTIFHLAGVIWLGVAEQVCYGKINIMEGLTLLSLSCQDQCLHCWTGYITQTRGHVSRASNIMHACSHCVYCTCAEHINAHRAAEISTHVCVCVSEPLNALMTSVLTQVF